MMAKNKNIGVIQKKCKFENRVAIPVKKFNPPPFFLNLVIFRPNTTDLVFIHLKVLVKLICPKSEPTPRPISKILGDLKKNDPKQSSFSAKWSFVLA